MDGRRFRKRDEEESWWCKKTGKIMQEATSRKEVDEREIVEGYETWSEKEGAEHVKNGSIVLEIFGKGRQA